MTARLAGDTSSAFTPGATQSPCSGGLERALWLWDGGAPTQPGPGPRVRQQLCLPWQDRHPRGVGQPHPDRAVLEGWPHAL